MKHHKQNSLELNAGTGMVLGIFVGAAIALLIQIITGDSSTWSWAIPVGLACGLAIGAGKQNGANKEAK
ncbi:MAG: hypothetical protein KC433_05535 [Anaerolineales bacterium]|nr:hypothetical protein [Anaerolineales bacterium]MCB8939463.1 hypothetical protein [Ardenticatenaceae bacterium]